MSFVKFREKFRRTKKLKNPVIDEEDYVAYLPSSSKAKVYNPIKKVRQYKIKKQGYQQFENEDDEPIVSNRYVRTGKPKLIRMHADGTVKRNAPPVPVTVVQDNRPRKVRIRADGSVKRRAPTPYKRSESDSDDLIDLQSQSSSSSSSDGEDPFANWQKFD